MSHHKIKFLRVRCSRTWSSAGGKTHNQTYHILTDRRWHPSTLDVRSVREADCHTDHYLVVAKVREKLEVSKIVAQNFDGERFNLRKLNDNEDRKRIRLIFQTSLQL